MILEEEKVSWTCGRNHSLTRTGVRYRCKCDNPDCARVFYRQEKEINKSHKEGSTRQYCNQKCMHTHYVGVCEHIGCDAKYSWLSMKRGLANKLCSKHSMRKAGREGQIKYRQRNKEKLYSLLGNRCVCCGEKDPMYLEIDHVQNDGKAHRTKINKKWGPDHIRRTSMHPRYLISYLKENPGGLQVLCANCNRAKSINKGVLYRPHKWTRRSSQGEKCTS